jgi:peptide chain release factor 2
VYIQLAEEMNDEESEKEAEVILKKLKRNVSSLEIKSLLSGKYDTFTAIFSLNAGAGGTDAQDWTEILLRMYTRYFEQKKWTCELLDETLGDEAGIKSVTLRVKGDFAYGLLKQETGIHRLVRISPFNANDKRQTSFAAVDVMPEISHDFSGVELDPKDLKVDTFRASGAGGQHVNKTDSAVRITHLPTGLVATSQASRSQIDNRQTALTLLKSRLIKVMEDEHKSSIQELKGISKDISWGNQIRSYVYHPYKLVKDLRTQVERTDLQAVMDGDIDEFIDASLRHSLKEKE